MEFTCDWQQKSKISDIIATKIIWIWNIGIKKKSTATTTMESFTNDIHAILLELNQSERQADEIISVVKIIKSDCLLWIFEKIPIH